MYSNTLSFVNESEITIECNDDNIKIFVNTTFLGKINSNFPVTIYVSVLTAGKTITLEEITSNDYLYHNNTNRTVIFNQENTSNRLHFSKCATANKFKMIGVEDENMGISCASGEAEEYFDVSGPLSFKSKMEIVYVNNQAVHRMFVRYSQNIGSQCGTDPECSTALFCYTCLP